MPVKFANRKAVYNKLMKIYGNSFQSILNHHSLKTFEEELYTSDAVVKQLKEPDFFDYQKVSLTEEPLILAGNSSKTCDSFEENNKGNIIFFSEGHVEAENFPLPSQEVQKTIEAIAQKVTRNIIDSKDM